MKGKFLFIFLFLFSSCTVKKEEGNIIPIPAREVKIVEGIESDVEIVRDKYGILHIYAENEGDLAFAQGYFHAHDRLFQMVIQRAAAVGELSMLLGASSIADDIKIRMFKFKKISEEIYKGGFLSDDEKHFLEKYAQGVNEFLKKARDTDLPLEFLSRGISAGDIYGGLFWIGDNEEGWSPVDSLSFAKLMTFMLSFDDEGSMGEQFLNIHKHLTRELLTRGYATSITDAQMLALQWIGEMNVYLPVRDAVIYYPGSGTHPPQPAPVYTSGPITSVRWKGTRLGEFIKKLRRITGINPTSNNWVVSGERTKSKSPILSNDPHLSLQQPPVFHEIHLNTKEAGGEINAGGVMFPMAPGIVIGFTENIAWGETTVGYDVTDFYLEKIINKEGEDVSSWQVFSQGGFTYPVPLTENISYLPGDSKDNPCEIPQGVKDELVELMIKMEDPIFIEIGDVRVCTVKLTYYEIKGHGPVFASLDINDDNDPDLLITARWTGFEPSSEISSFKKYLTAQNIYDFKEAVKLFKVGAQNQVVIDKEGNIAWYPHARVPIRYPPSCSNPDFGLIPNPLYLPQPGDGSCDWKGYAEDFTGNFPIPYLENPPPGFIVTANNLPVPLTWPYYHGLWYDLGYRAGRITERIVEKLGELTVEDMMDIQADSLSLLCKDFLGVLTSTIEENSLNDQGRKAFNYLKKWNCETPSGYEYDPEGEYLYPSGISEEREKSIAQTVFHAWFSNFLHFTFDDHLPSGTGFPGGSQVYVRAMYDIIYRKKGESNFWDDWTTSFTETMTDISRKAFEKAISGISIKLGSNVDEWLWGKLHTLTVRHLADNPSVEGDTAEMFNIPSPFDVLTRSLGLRGFPRHGGQFAVDASDPGFDLMTEDSQGDYSYSGGPSYRIIVEMKPDGPHAYTAIPGGNEARPSSKYYANQLREFWWANKYKKFPFTKEEVMEASDYLIILRPEKK